ncbi:hypothetical protein J4468_01110 [Candidatus Woesearchaeota archaeon]|nr:hypothetical protein [Candidatus Woesearchaeota archaeon]
MKGYSVEGGIIVIDRELTELDLFVKKFLKVLKKHADYLIVSGFVSISTGRARGTEDVDIIVSIMNENKFVSLFNDLIENKFWCYQGDNSTEVYPYIKNMNSVRFAEINKMYPNIELVPFDKSKKAKSFEYSHPQKIKVGDFEFKIPPIEFEILYKEIILAGKKDMEDAKHLRTFFSDLIKEENFKRYEIIIRDELK